MTDQELYDAVYKWMREPDLVDKFSNIDLMNWANHRPISELMRMNPKISDSELGQTTTLRENPIRSK